MRKLIITGDGSHSVSEGDTSLTFHSRHGAISESLHVFINEGLLKLLNELPLISIFEIGFGTGLNALLSMRASEHSATQIHYETCEPAPLPADIVRQLNYCEQLKRRDLQDSFLLMHECAADKPVEISSGFTLLKHLSRLEDSVFSRRYHLVYWDAFDPVNQPELWTAQIFSDIHSHMHTRGMLLTYSSKSIVQRALREAGFDVEKVAGPRGKREIIRATVT